MLGYDVPGTIGALRQRFDLVVLDHLGAAHFRSTGIGVNDAIGVDIPLAIRPEPADHALDVHDRTFCLDLIGRHQVTILDADRLKDAVGGLQPLPTRGG